MRGLPYRYPWVGGAQRAWGKRLPLKAGGAMQDELDQISLVSRSGDSEDSFLGLNNRNGVFHNLQFEKSRITVLVGLVPSTGCEGEAVPSLSS